MPKPYSSAAIFLLLLLSDLLPSPIPKAADAATDAFALLAGFPDLSDFSRLLSASPVAGELAARSSLTLLAVPNSRLPRLLSPSSAADLADSLRLHVLLQYLSPHDLHVLPPVGTLVTTLFQTTGRASGNLGAVNLTASSVFASSSSNASILGFVAAVPYNLSIFAVDALLFPSGADLAASEARPALPAVNITRVLSDARGFNVAASMLAASGVASEFESDERGAGITVFVPTDEAFAGLPATERLQSLPADRKASVLRFHALHSYYPLGSLESIVNPVQPTLATEATAAGLFTLNITRVNGSVAIDTGVVQAAITRTVFDQNPVAVFAVSSVLLPKDIFGLGRLTPAAEDPMAMPPEAAAPDAATAAAEQSGSQPARLSTPPGTRIQYSSAVAPTIPPAAKWRLAVASLLLSFI